MDEKLTSIRPPTTPSFRRQTPYIEYVIDIHCHHYSADVCQITGTRLFVCNFFQANNADLLREESIGNWWIPLIKGQ